jgi:hypothetical protein
VTGDKATLVSVAHSIQGDNAEHLKGVHVDNNNINISAFPGDQKTPVSLILLTGLDDDAFTSL